MKLEDLRKQARSGIAPEASEKPKRARKHVQEMDLRALAKCAACGSTAIQIIERDRDVLRNVDFCKVKCRDCGELSQLEIDEETRLA